MAQKKEIDEAVDCIKKAIEKKIAENTEVLIRSEIEKTLLEDFLETLCHKVEQINQINILSAETTKHFINFSCEIPKIETCDVHIPNELIKLVHEVNLEFFFKKETNLHLFNFCSKYFLFSHFDNTKKVNVINFNWSKNKFDESKICFCFMCKFNLELCEQQEEKKQEPEKNDN